MLKPCGNDFVGPGSEGLAKIVASVKRDYTLKGVCNAHCERGSFCRHAAAAGGVDSMMQLPFLGPAAGGARGARVGAPLRA